MNQPSVFNTINGKDVDCSPPRPAVPFARTQMSSVDPGNLRLRKGVQSAGETAYRVVFPLGGQDAADAAQNAAACAFASSAIATRGITNLGRGEYGTPNLPPSRYLETALASAYRTFAEGLDDPEIFALSAQRASVCFENVDALITDKLDCVAAAVAAGFAGVRAAKLAARALDATLESVATTKPSSSRA